MISSEIWIFGLRSKPTTITGGPLRFIDTNKSPNFTLQSTESSIYTLTRTLLISPRRLHLTYSVFITPSKRRLPPGEPTVGTLSDKQYGSLPDSGPSPVSCTHCSPFPRTSTCSTNHSPMVAPGGHRANNRKLRVL